ncbi:MAG TPA: winged helix-turn-helix domain-containing protein [Nitrososphaeraceae archaeon]|jgi:predicted transcriptional regulator|nr:winged helix-turn-helix domain-containing protein [Nitrososphaeraceae archaeon]
MEYRDRSRIEAAILKATAKDSNNKGLKRREIMHKAAIPDVYLKAYMQLLHQKELIEYDNQKQVFRITDKGMHYLNLDNEINDLLA